MEIFSFRKLYICECIDTSRVTIRQTTLKITSKNDISKFNHRLNKHPNIIEYYGHREEE